MGALMRAYDWSASALGAPDGWPQPLKTLAGVMLAANQPMFVAWGADRTLLYNDAYSEILGNKHPSALGCDFFEVWSEIRADLVPIVGKAYAGEPVHMDDIELWIERKGHPEETHFAFSYTPVRDESGTVAGFFCPCVEITQQVLVERGRAGDSERQRQLFEQAPGFIAILSTPEHIFEFANASYKRLVGDRDFVGKTVREAIPELEGQGFFELLDRVYVSGERFLADHIPILIEPLPGSPSEERFLDFICEPVVDEGGRVTGIFVEGYDVTDAHRAEAELRELNDTLESRVSERSAELEQAHEQLRQSQKLEAMGQLTGGVAHDFNNLLTPIVGSLDLLHRKGLGGERERRLIDGALQSAERARVLVQRLLAFARRQPLQTQAVDVGALVEGMADLVASTSGPRVKVEIDVTDNLSPAWADFNQVEMAILNLAVNARDAMPDGGTLTISATPVIVGVSERSAVPPGRYVRLSVADTGTGMDETTLNRAIEPFFSTKGIGRGTGLGLSMVHGLALQLGGGLAITSKPRLGTCVELFLPASDEALRQTESPEDSDSRAAAGTVLLVDDEELVRASTADMLAELGYAVVEADSAEDALRLVNGGLAPDLLVTDHLMPGLSGTELAHELRGRWRDLPVLLVSGFAEAEDVAPDLVRLVKPFRQADLAAKLRELGDAATK